MKGTLLLKHPEDNIADIGCIHKVAMGRVLENIYL